MDNNSINEKSYSELDPQLHFLGHLALALSTTCLLESEIAFVPGLIMFLPLFYGFLWISYVSKGRRILSTSVSNVLGILISVLGCFWVFSKVSRDVGAGAQSLPMPTALVPFVGPILAFLVMLRLFGPKGRRDFWILQGMGMLQVSLACVLTTGTIFAFLFSTYLLSLVWILKRYQATRGEVELSTNPLESRPSLRSMGLFPSMGWTLLLGILSVGIFLITPRTDSSSWNPLLRFGQARGTGGTSVTGFAEQMNLNKTGEVELNDDIAMTVFVTDVDGNPYSGLPLDQRWRGAVLEHYDNGLWNRRITRKPPPKTVQTELPFFGPEQLVFHYQLIPRKVGGLFVADPIRFNNTDPATRLPVVIDPPYQEMSFFYEQGSTVQYSMGVSKIRQPIRYRQVVPLKSQGERVVATLDNEFLGDLITPRIGSLEEWTLGILESIKDNPRYGLQKVSLPRGFARERARPSIESTYREAVARALSNYLSQSGDYTYTLELKRSDFNVDPVVDFLLNVKKGHCERYASGLVLMLRSLGIPSRVIKGFRGCTYSENGNYVVRNNQAHSWVEVLVPQLSSDGAFKQDLVSGRPIFDWLTLDPTPDSELLENQKFSLLRMIAELIDRAKTFWRDMIVDYNAEQQAEFWYRLFPDMSNINLQRFITSLPKIFLGVGFTLLAGVGLVLGLPRLVAGIGSLKYVGQSPARIQYDKLKIFALMHLRLSPAPGETPLEFAARIKTELLHFQLEPPLVMIPEKIARTLYAVRFGMADLNKNMADLLASQLLELQSQLIAKKRAYSSGNRTLVTAE
jgi:transglutaminase-like putative cysteine protease